MVGRKFGTLGVGRMKKYYIFVILILLLGLGCTNCFYKEMNAKDEVIKNGSYKAESPAEYENSNNLWKEGGEKMNRLIINVDKTYQTIESFGTSGCWWAQYVGGWDNEYKDTGRSVREEIAMLLFDRDYGIGLTNYRYNLGAGSADSGKGNFQDPHRRASSFEIAPFVYDWNKDANAVWFLKKAVELGVQEVVLFCNSPLERLTVNGLAHMTPDTRVNLLPENYDDFTRYVMDVAEHFVEEGIPVRFISPINEPQWDWFGGQEGCHYEPTEVVGVYKAFLKELESRPSLAGVKLSGPESGEWKGKAIAYTSAILNDQVLKEHFTTIDNHSYWTNAEEKRSFKNWMNAFHPEVKLRMSEWCEMVNGSDYTMDSAFHLAEEIVEDLTILEVVSWASWVAVAPGGYRDGLIYVNEKNQSMEITRRLWAFGNYSKFIRPGYIRVDVKGERNLKELKPVAFKGVNEANKEELVVVLVNESDATKEFMIDLNQSNEYNKIYIYETSDHRDLDCIFEGKYDDQMGISLNPMSISTIILTKE